ncbi:MAG: right-handed parallel beta-helix repeat-containing protein [Lachnospiraceae bacterium]|nr:right-handed parallel beta-helix repeat-containing protein [Lachnospiraceae bacterium]
MELIKKRSGVLILTLLVLLTFFSLKADADVGVLATVSAGSWWDGDCHYNRYYIIRNEICDVSGNDQTEYSHSDHYTLSKRKHSRDGSYIYYYTQIDEYYDYYPTLASAASKSSYVTACVGDGASFCIRKNLDAYEQVIVDHDITIFGEGHSITNCGINMDIIYATSGTVCINDLRLDGNHKICNVDMGTGVGSACITNDGADMTMNDCEVYGSHNARSMGVEDDAGGTGVECFSGNTTIDGCRISDCDGFGIYVGNWRSPSDCSASKIEIKETTIFDCAGGVGNAYGAEVTLEGGSISATRWYKRGVYNSREGTFTITSGEISDCDQGIMNLGELYLRGGELSDNEVGIFQDGKLYISGSPRLSIDEGKNDIVLTPEHAIEVDDILTGKGRIGSILLLDTDRALGRELIRITYDTSDREILALDTTDIASRFVPAFDEVEDVDSRNEEGADATSCLSAKDAEVFYTHPESGTHLPAFRAGAGHDKNGNIYNGQVGTVVLSECLHATFDLNSNITDVKLSMKKPGFDFYWMEPMTFPTKRRVDATLNGKNIDTSLALLGWSLRPDGSKRVYANDEIMSMPNDFCFYPVLDATMAMTYHSNYRLPDRQDISYQVYPLCDGMHSENIIRGNTGPGDDRPDYLTKSIEMAFDDINYGRMNRIVRYRHMGWSPTEDGITYKNASDDDPMTHMYVRDEDGGMQLYGDISLNIKRCISSNDRRLFRLRFLSDYIKTIGADYTEDGKYFNIHMYSVWDEAPYLCVKNVEILEGDIDKSLEEMLLERIHPGDERHEKRDHEDVYEDINIVICDMEKADFLDRFKNLGDMGSVTVDYEAWDMAGNHSVYPVKVTVLSGSHHRVLKEKDDVESGLKRSAFYYRFIDDRSRDTLLPDSLWRVQKEYKDQLDKALQKRGEIEE